MMSFSYNILTVGYSQFTISKGFILPVKIDFSSVPHLLIVAPSGSGKTYLLTYLLGQIAQKPVKLILADFKGIDFIEFNGCASYYKHTAIGEALDYVFGELQERMANASVNSNYEPIYFCVDEWSGFLSSLSVKKEQDSYKQKLSNVLMLGRGVKIFVIMALQRADANYITGRDNFGNAIGLGSLSKESISMLFNDDKELIQPKPRGKGYLRTDGKQLAEIVVPQIRDISKTKEIIKKSLSKSEES